LSLTTVGTTKERLNNSYLTVRPGKYYDSRVMF